MLFIVPALPSYASEFPRTNAFSQRADKQYAVKLSLLTIIVDPNGSGNLRTIKDAVIQAGPGQTILVKNGTYNRKLDFRTSGTARYPITLKAYNGHKPVLDFSNSPDENPRVEIDADYITIEGLEIRNGWDGVKIHGDNNIVLNNFIHDNDYQGVLIVNAGNNIIENNTISRNGIKPGTCIFDGASSPRHCHGIYISNYECKGGCDGNVIRGNHILTHGGTGIQWNGISCKNLIEHTVVENNRIENNSWGIVLYHGVYNSVIRNNTFISRSMPRTNDKTHTLIGIYGSENNVIENNVLDAEHPDFSGLFVFDKASSNNKVNKNSWKLASPNWIWEGDNRRDWQDYTSVTGWGKDSTFQMYKR